MFDKIVAGFLTTYLGEYFQNIDTEQVKISLWGGNVHLKNLRFRKDALRLLDVPFCVADGVIEDLVVTIPWSHLQSESVVMVMDGVCLSLEEKRSAQYDITQCLLDAMQRRRRELEISEEAMLVQWEEEEARKLAEVAAAAAAAVTTGSSSSSSKKGAAKEEAEDASTNTFMARLKSCMINNVKLELKRVTVQYRGLFPGEAEAATPASSKRAKSNSASGEYDGRGGTVLALHIDEIRSYSCNEKYEPCFSPIQLKMMHKVMLINGIGISLAPADAAAAATKETRIVYPFNVGIKLQYQPIPYDRTQPSYLLGISLTPVQTALRTEQMRVGTALLKEILSAQEQEERRLLRPVGATPTEDPRAWWRYAIQSTLLTIRKRRQVSGGASSAAGKESATGPRRSTTFSWKKVIEMRKKRQVYIQLYKRSRRTQLRAAAWTEPITPVEAKQLQCMEEGDLPVETIKLARRMAIEEVGLERTEYKKLKDAHSQAAAEAEGRPQERG
ncbi:hypothetical protein STCU_08345 [Strigomonas culicis]|uniref:Chorein N-terminal domain-containing protein n=1 Tax=Strigomonas culicis TaxID=28005 RepID=S9TUP1_9TRYP|nr:hypothetical protein STCU_08345 [Strigomonas culicis]|eukprot:EPY22107.1 hypothetical protein STCU_08345 [Strigomonas culicis]